MTDPSLDQRPVILAVDDEDASREVLERCLSGRYGRDYQVVTEASATAAFDRLRALRLSDYLVRELESQPNIEIRTNSEIAEALGDRRLERVVLRDRATGATDELPATAVFILIGAAPRTDWLPPEIARDEGGFVLTGPDRPTGDAGSARSFETTMPGVFGVGDVRHGSLKRVASAAGEGSTAIRQVHDYRSEGRTR